MEPLESYYTRFWKRFRKDATPWARDNIIWGVTVLVVPAVVAYLRDPHGQIDWVLIRNSLILYAFAFSVYILAYLRLTPKRLDDDRQEREQLLLATIADREQTIRKRDETVRILADKPKHTPAEQHDYDIAKKALQLLKEKGVAALRHIRRQGSLTFGIGMATGPLPRGLSFNDTLWVYNHCASEGLLTCSEKIGSGLKTFAVSPKMEKILDEVLYEEGPRSEDQ